MAYYIQIIRLHDTSSLHSRWISITPWHCLRLLIRPRDDCFWLLWVQGGTHLTSQKAGAATTAGGKRCCYQLFCHQVYQLFLKKCPATRNVVRCLSPEYNSTPLSRGYYEFFVSWLIFPIYIIHLFWNPTKLKKGDEDGRGKEQKKRILRHKLTIQETKVGRVWPLRNPWSLWSLGHILMPFSFWSQFSPFCSQVSLLILFFSIVPQEGVQTTGLRRSIVRDIYAHAHTHRGRGKVRWLSYLVKEPVRKMDLVTNMWKQEKLTLEIRWHRIFTSWLP